MAFDLSAGELNFISVNLNGQGDMTDFIAQPAVKLVKTASTAVRSTLRVENANFCFISPEDFPPL